MKKLLLGYTVGSMALGTWASLQAGLNRWQVAASSLLSPVIFPAAAYNETRERVSRGETWREQVRRVVQFLQNEICPRCGGLMIRTGTCYTCTSCGDSTGCGITRSRGVIRDD